jgi:hypothetical protein
METIVIDLPTRRQNKKPMLASELVGVSSVWFLHVGILVVDPCPASSNQPCWCLHVWRWKTFFWKLLMLQKGFLEHYKHLTVLLCTHELNVTMIFGMWYKGYLWCFKYAYIIIAPFLDIRCIVFGMNIKDHPPPAHATSPLGFPFQLRWFSGSPLLCFS